MWVNLNENNEQEVQIIVVDNYNITNKNVYSKSLSILTNIMQRVNYNN